MLYDTTTWTYKTGLCYKEGSFVLVTELDQITLYEKSIYH